MNRGEIDCTANLHHKYRSIFYLISMRKRKEREKEKGDRKRQREKRERKRINVQQSKNDFQPLCELSIR
jgi:hypothetical protein